MRELPHLVQLHRDFPDEVVCITFNMNHADPEESPETLREEVLNILQKRDVTCLNIIASDIDTDLYDKLNLAAVPAVYVYNQQGQLTKRFDGSSGEIFSYQNDIIPHVAALLTE